VVDVFSEAKSPKSGQKKKTRLGMIKLQKPHGDDDLGCFLFSLGFATQLGDSPRACGSELGPNDLP